MFRFHVSFRGCTKWDNPPSIPVLLVCSPFLFCFALFVFALVLSWLVSIDFYFILFCSGLLCFDCFVVFIFAFFWGVLLLFV